MSIKKNAQLGCITVLEPLRLIIEFFKNGDLRSFLLTIRKMVHDAKTVQSFRVQNVEVIIISRAQVKISVGLTTVVPAKVSVRKIL